MATSMATSTNATDTSRRSFLKLAGVIGAGAVIAGTIAACGGPASTSADPQTTPAGGGAKPNLDGTIEAGISYALSTGFDPMTTSGAVTMAANWHVLEGLVELDPAARTPYAALGKELPKKIDETTWEVTLRDGATFHDGSPVTTDDVVFSFNRVLDPANASLYSQFLPFLASVAAKDDKTVTFTLNYPFGLFVDRVSVVKIVPQAIVEADPKAYDSLPVGSGPYKLTSATVDDKITFERFDAYNGSRPALAKAMTWNLLSDAAARVTAVESGRVQAIEDVPYLDADRLANAVTVESVQSFGLLFMMFDCSKAPFTDKRVRQAFFHALDMDKIISTGLLGNATAATSFLHKEHPSYVKASTVYSHDPAKAKKLLADAGVGSMAITLLTTDTSWVKDVAPLIKEDLDAVGISTTLDIGQSGGQYKKVDDGGLEVMVAPGDPSVFGNDPDLLLRWWYSGSVWPVKRYRWASTPEFAEVTRLLDQGAAEQDAAKQKKTWGEVFDILSDEVPLYPLLHRKLPSAWEDSALDGFKPLPVTGLSFLDVSRTA
ncbi:twin-arginine translocation signal domain-containing protein [Oerskovia turbata]|uniref:Twin-arginine translocation signal domain-containing protein n=2 Tax=Oerskovia turbata TaxID=1713 RepID=A0A4Q1L1V2_9CELL|nr:twin-arginine translocation signal domain-containing protein [Oerskovia turbata]RXR36676.1 twin-arginine translocation signal domain-containing protein [Oerskovia turbata]TGJ97366.1 peptide ABC transporter substrate-binding protein [Actinotalea fermentans ATCC 43279 = JCM 9966 = DSM 3133]